jgi:hypothetical protein
MRLFVDRAQGSSRDRVEVIDMKNLSLLSIATLLGLSFTSGCDIGDDLGTSDDNTDATDDDVGTTDATTDETTDETTETGEPALCGWNARSAFYECGFEGAEPEGNFPIECPDGLAAGDPCQTSGLTGEGCCDANGDNWYCTDGGVVFFNACGPT